MAFPLRFLSGAMILAMFLSSTISAPDEETTEWVGQILLGSEYDRKSVRCTRWVKSPTLSVLDANETQAVLVKETVDHLNETLRDTRIKAIRLVAPNNYDAKILVRFAPLADLPAVASRHSIKYVEGNWGYFSTHSNKLYQITQAIVLIASDKVHGDTLRHFLLEEITQSLGPKNDSPIFKDSIFYSRMSRTKNPTQLSARDKHLLLFLYNHVSPGAKPAELLTAIENYWVEK